MSREIWSRTRRLYTKLITQKSIGLIGIMSALNRVPRVYDDVCVYACVYQ